MALNTFLQRDKSLDAVWFTEAHNNHTTGREGLVAGRTDGN
jgi:hypothetical protein